MKSTGEISKDIRKQLERLQAFKLITPNQLDKSLSAILSPRKRASLQKTVPTPPPLEILMFCRTVLFLRNLENNISEIDKKAEEIVDSWNRGEIKRKKARNAVEELAQRRRKLAIGRQQLISSISSPLLKESLSQVSSSTERSTDLSPDEEERQVRIVEQHLLEVSGYLKFLERLENFSSEEVFKNALKRRNDVLAAHVRKIEGRLENARKAMGSKELETRVLEGFFSEQRRDTFPISINIDLGLFAKTLPSSTQLEIFEDKTTPSETSSLTFQEKTFPEGSLSVDPWETPGRVLIDTQGRGLGICAEPILSKDNGSIFLTCQAEHDLLVEKILQDTEFLPFFVQKMGIKPENFEEILREEVTRSLGLPKEFSLFPTLLRRFALKNNLEFPDNLLPLEDPPATYYPISSVKESSMKTHLISSSAPKQIILSQPPPSSIPDFLKAVEVDVKVYDYLSQEIGSFKGFMKSKFLGDFLLIQFAKPSSQFIHKILKILHSRDSSIVQEPHVIQARIAQRFSISEPQAFLLPHLWRYCFGNLPVLPWEVKISYFGLVPAGAVRTVEQDIITLKPRLSYHDIDEILPWDSWQCKDIVQDETPQGKVVGFDIVENEKLWHLVVLVSHQKTKEILSGFGRGTASEEEAYHSRIQKRISTTLNIPLEVGLCPDNIARYFLHYALSDSCQDFSTAFKTLENILELKPVPIEKFQDVSTQCIILE